MAIKYILDLTKEEYRDDFVSLAEVDDKKEGKEFWQFEARDRLIDRLCAFLKDAQAYNKERSLDDTKTWLSHNAILVNGGRGTGKTVFLRNCKAMWQYHCKQNDHLQASSIHFMPSIDPTMLIDHDNFANVIIAQIYTEVERVFESGNGFARTGLPEERQKSIFYRNLQVLADSLGKKEEFEGVTGIDRILQYKSGISIEQHFHRYVESALEILDCDAIALPIDDVDMALERAYEVVDQVRRLLGCPYIIPIVSGDYGLYEQMVELHFDAKAYSKQTKNTSQIEKGKQLSKELTSAYLTKVFPNQMRITLVPIEHIYPTLEFNVLTSTGAQPYHYRNYVKAIFNEFYPLCLNEEVLNDWPQPTSAREFTQLARAILPSDLDAAKTTTEISYKLWKNYFNWAEQKQSGFAYTNVNSYLTLKNQEAGDLFNIMQLPSFNPKLQINKEHFFWGGKRFLRSQCIALGVETSSEGQQKIKNSEKDAWKRDNLALLKAAFDFKDRVIASMPPLEFYHPNSTVSNKTVLSIEKDLVLTQVAEPSDSPSKETVIASCSLDELLISVYTQKSAYSTLVNNYQFVFVSRAFEIIMYSFLQLGCANNIADNLQRMLQRRPFYSIFNIAPTKALEDEAVGGGEEVSAHNQASNEESAQKEVSHYLAQSVLQWRQTHDAFFKSLDAEKLVPIFSFIFNKSLTAFNSFKVNDFAKGSSYQNEYLTDYVKRFEYMLINAAYSAMIEGTAVQASVAVTKRQQTIRDPKEFSKYDRTLTRNIAMLESQVPNTEDVKWLFIKALESHPLFTLLLEGPEQNAPIKTRIKLGDISGESPPENNVPKSSVSKASMPSEMKKLLINYARRKGDIYRDVKVGLKGMKEYLEHDLSRYGNEAKEFYTMLVMRFPDARSIRSNAGSNLSLNLYKAMHDRFERKS
ncbi:hypothetical protein L1286_05995 [Pseudoalteromonas sp. SMS1]|uniref:antiviral RADAR system adenosine triphosphatase RdrA n=1 Tax=Pseudoalteromonas sp. SMS1 TaxID=2908894 RepID=UPI001F2C2CCA|nr:antiviral RADAR system adenosine triphosphatase RdrA [Pseudoalteromonas sp. SMS1]MCF2857010.1 hypothetical protein [Pseudoalteromonas sp. SMS1]